MYPGPLGNSQIRREFSTCSLLEIGKVLDETQRFCLLTREETRFVATEPLLEATEEPSLDTSTVTDNLMINITESEGMENKKCGMKKVQGQLDSISSYLIDLKHYLADKQTRKTIFRLNRKLSRVRKTMEEASVIDDELRLMVTNIFLDVKSTFAEFQDELSIFLARKILNLHKAILKCIHNMY